MTTTRSCSILEGLSYGCGDVIIGLNPAADELDEIVRLEELLERVVRRLALPTRYCVLSDMVKQHAAQRHTRVDVGFQSLAGTSGALTGMVGLDVDDLTDLAAAFDGLYFETGQGSAVTNGHAEGVDMVTLEARAYGVARHIQRRVADRRGKAPWMIVNDVAGFIGPEVFRHEAQLERACLEDIVMAKLHGLTMGLDVCATFHMGIAPDQLRRLTARIANRAAPAYLMAVAGNADPMLGYLTTSFREHPQLRQSSGRRIASVMDRRLGELSAASERTPSLERPAATAGLYAAYTKAGGDRRTELALQDDGRRRLHALRERGFDLGGMPASEAAARVEAIYTHARSALYACLDANVIRDASARSLWVRSQARDRDDYLAHPEGGERIPPHDRRSITDLYAGGAPQALIVVSDGLNANAVNEHLRTLLPVLRRQLAADGSVGETDIIVENGRVRAGYEIGELTAAEILIHLIGERPGTGLNCLSCYVTYGRDDGGRMRWNRRLDHSATNAICGIHPHGKPLDVAASEIARTVRRIREQRRSGVALNPSAAKARPRS